MLVTSDPAMPDDDDPERAVSLFVAERLLEHPGPVHPGIGLAELVGWLMGDTPFLGAQINRALLQRPALRADLAALRARLVRMELPRVAAASEGDLDERPLAGGVLSLFAPAEETVVYVSVRQEDPPPPDLMLSLLLTTPGGEVLVLPLPAFNDEGTVTVILDSADAGDAALIAALRAPQTRGDFIERRGPRDD